MKGFSELLARSITFSRLWVSVQAETKPCQLIVGTALLSVLANLKFKVSTSVRCMANRLLL